MTNDIRDMFSPLTVPAPIVQVLQLKLVTINNSYHKALEPLQRDLGSTYIDLDAADLTEDQRDDLVTREHLQKQLAAINERVGNLIMLSDGRVSRRMTDDEAKTRRAVMSAKQQAVIDAHKAEMRALYEVGHKMIAAHIAAVRVKVPAELLTELDAIGGGK